MLSDNGRYFINTYSQVDTAPKSELFDAAGLKLADLEPTDVTALTDAGFKFPEPFKVKADDGVTDLFGVMYKPFDFDPEKRYPIIAYVYPGPQTESVTKTFSPRSQSMTLAQMGFIVIEIGNRGGHPQRSKWYHNYGYGEPARLRARRQEGRHRAAGAQAPVDRHEPGRDLRPFGRRASCPRPRCWSTRTSSRWPCPRRATTRTTSTTGGGARSTTG